MILPLPAPQAPAQALSQPQPAAVTAAAARRPVRAQYAWSYEAADANGSGTLSLLMDPAGGRLVLEIHSYGERVAFLSGDAAGGYRLQIPKEGKDLSSPSLAELPLPFLPDVKSVDALLTALERGEGPGLTVLKRGDGAPLKLRYKSLDEKGESILLWLTRKRWETP
ncbi:MAG TPA: hypothetical protein VJ483_00385 [Holophagaceae bacterium]|nr:hypothetical protein [Holophagaceae bacterium]